MTTEQKTLGQIAYEMYKQTRSVMLSQWAPIALWAMVLPSERAVWDAAANAVVREHEARRGALPPTTLHLRVDTSPIEALLAKAIADVRAEFAPATQPQGDYRVSRDGNLWCATGPGFVNLQASHAGFATTPLGALRSLLGSEPASATTSAVSPTPLTHESFYRAEEFRVDTYVPPHAISSFAPTPANGVRVTHVPSGLVEECHEERGQHRNRTLAFERLTARLDAIQRKEPPL